LNRIDETGAAHFSLFMGRTYLFECSKCGYHVKVAGGASDGERFSVQTILCYDCRALYDAVTSLKVVAPRIGGDTGASKPISGKSRPLKTPTFASVLNKLPLAGRTRSRWQRYKLTCPVSLLHRIREWKQPDKCPRCGVFLDTNAIPFREWD
jgi:hypothetical protein